MLKVYSRVVFGGRLQVFPVYGALTLRAKKVLSVKGCICRKSSCPLRSEMSLPTGVPVTHHL